MARLRLVLAATALLAGTAAAPHATAAPVVATEVFTGIRPGSLMTSPRNCTVGFVFQSTGNAFDPAQQLYLGVARHCVDSVNQRVRLDVVSPVTRAPVTIDVGDVWLIGVNDVAFVEVDPTWNSWVSPTLAHWGGPVGVDTTATAGTPVTCTGHPLAAPGAPRTGVVLSRTFSDVSWLCPTVNGDSGGPVTTLDGLALAAVQGENIGAAGTVGAGALGPSIQSMLSQGGKPLATCASRTPWPSPGCPPV